MSLDDYEALEETAYLLRSPKNARRLLTALDRVHKTSGTPQTIDDLRDEVGFE